MPPPSKNYTIFLYHWRLHVTVNNCRCALTSLLVALYCTANIINRSSKKQFSTTRETYLTILYVSSGHTTKTTNNRYNN